MSETRPEDPQIPADHVWYNCTCHCGNTTFSFHDERLTEVASCNCSICQKNGYLLTYLFRNQMTKVRGWDELKNYRFGSKTRDHKFCGTCGTSIGIDMLGKHRLGDIVAINVRIVADLDLTSIQVRHAPGRDFQPEYNDQHPVIHY